MNQFPIQNLNIQGSIPEKRDIQINLKDKARNRNRNPSKRKNTLKQKKMNNNNPTNIQNNNPTKIQFNNPNNIHKNTRNNIQNNIPTNIQNNNPTNIQINNQNNNIQNNNPINIQNNHPTNIQNNNQNNNIQNNNPTNNQNNHPANIQNNNQNNNIQNNNPANIQNNNLNKIQNNNSNYNQNHNLNNNINNYNYEKQTQIQPIKRSRKTAQKPQNIIRRNSKPDLTWLNKYFIYRHESLNKYINTNEFKICLEKAKDNYEKLIRQLNNNRANVNMLNNDKNILQQNKIINNNINANLIPERKQKKIFIVTGGYCDVVSNLKDRGWEQEKNPTCIEFNYIWTLKTNEINFILLKNDQLCNHYFRNGQITRKSGLCKNIKNLYYKGIDPMNFFPRCYDLSIKIELEDFRQDFKFTWAISLLKLLQKEEQENSRISPKSNKFSDEVISTAVNIVERNIKYLNNKGNFIQNINELNNNTNNSKLYLITDEEWNKIYLPELTQNSNVQDIIYEVNSNKPGGVNNPIKGNNKTVPKKIIKPNNTKKMLVSTQKAQAGNLDKFSPNLNSIIGLKSKIEKMNIEEKKNNLNTNDLNEKPLNVNLLKKRNSRINNSTTNCNVNINKNSTNSNYLKKGEGVFFENYKTKIDQILSILEKNLPQYKLNGFRNIWIMKPSNLSRGRGVTCVDSLLPIEQSLSATNDSGLIVQKYIENPLIIQNRKFDIRQWVLVTCLNPLIIWMWKEPYIRFGAEDYKMDDLNNIYSHLTNNSIAKHSKQYKKEKKFEGDMWTCSQFEQFLGSNKWKEIHQKIKNAIICSFYSAHQEIRPRYNSHELYGYDFMIDEEFNVYLIEVNASPALDYSTKITETAVKDMVKDLIKIVIDNNNARDCKVNNNGEIINTYGEIIPNKFIQIFNENNKDCIKIPENIPNKSMFY